MPSDDGPDLAQVVVLGGLGVLAGGSVLVLATGAVAGVLFGRGAPSLGLSEASDVLMALPGALSDPRLAWPVGAQGVLPGQTAFLVSFALVLAVAVFSSWQECFWSLGSSRGDGVVTRRSPCPVVSVGDPVLASDWGRSRQRSLPAATRTTSS